MSDFAGLRIALSSLHTQRRALEVTGHNVANANTAGYTRQRVDMANMAGPTAPAQYSKFLGSGMGVEVADITRLRDTFLETRGLAEHAVEADLKGAQQIYARVELAFAEPGTNGISAQLDELWQGWDDVASNPGSLATRNQLLETANTLADSFNQVAKSLDQQREANVEQLGAVVADVNATATSLARLNVAIQDQVRSGFTPNDLMDQRDQLAGVLAEHAGATVREGVDGAVDVFLGSASLVSGGTTASLTVDEAGSPVTVEWSDGTAATVPGGTAHALLTGVNEILPRQLTQLDAVAAKLRDDVNALHMAGKDLNGNPAAALFSGAGATDLRVALTDPAGLAAAAGSATGVLDGANAQALANLGDAADGIGERYRSMIVELGVEAQTVNRRVDIQAEITKQVDAARDSAAGVNLDEEMTNLIAFQHAYDAAARFMSAIDEALDTLINRTGTVGR